MIVHLNTRGKARRGDAQRTGIQREPRQGAVAVILAFPHRRDFARPTPSYEALLSRLQTENDVLRGEVAELTAQIREISEKQAKVHKSAVSLLP
jgi:hypothetical protein